MGKYPKVIDIYSEEPVTSFQKIAESGIWGVIHKASQGSTYRDPKYSARKKAAKEAGLLWGAYHFASAAPVDAQVKNFLEASEWSIDNDILLCLDYEDGGKNTMSISQAKEFCTKIYEKTGQRPVLYSGNLAKETISGKDEFWSKHRLWLAQYGPKAVIQKSWDKYWLWQYAADGIGEEPKSIPGLPLGPKTDVNWFEGTKEELQATWLG